MKLQEQMLVSVIDKVNETEWATVGDVDAPDLPDGTKVTFRTRYARARLSRSQSHRVPEMGMLKEVGRQLAYEFSPQGVLVVAVGQDRLPDGPDGEVQDAVDWLRRHAGYNAQGNRFPAFHEVGREAAKPVPDERVAFELVLDAVIAGEADALEEIKRRETATHSRALVLDAVNRGMERLATAV